MSCHIVSVTTMLSTVPRAFLVICEDGGAVSGCLIQEVGAGASPGIRV